ncbi:MAG: hypothetical protein OEZ65_05845 [Gemmatimonadota bacterium]|nr:hypothetical protein [Gemmatimonadota bacterium]
MSSSIITRAGLLLLTASVPVIGIPGAIEAQTARPITSADMESFHARVIGPAVTGGRVHDIEAIPGDPSTLYVASASGGLWKSTNRAHTWVNVFDTMAVSTFGDVALAPSNPDIVYAGTGEQNNRQSTSYGNGVYRSDDGGDSWRHLGLAETRHIGKVEIHPTDPDVAYVAALGNLWAASDDRGVYRTTDGGASWEKVLFIDRYTGAVDLVMDPTDPNVLYAATYQRLRRAWGFNGGGPGSGIYKTTDGGDHWTELTQGIPAGDKGRIGLAISASNPAVLNALVEHADRDMQGTYRTTDGGASWERVSDMNGRPMYYSEIFIDPSDENTVYALATTSNVSHDGGRTWSQIALAPTYDVGVHADHHALWIDPADPEHLYLGGDAGLHESYDGGTSFRKLNNFPIAQFYAMGVDMRDPYWVYGGLQDNHSFMGPSETRRFAGILNDDWMQNGFGDGMYWQADPRDARYTYGSSNGGSYFRYDTHTGDMMEIGPEPAMGEESYRFDWTSPMMLSQHNPDVLYVAGNRFFVSRDRGESWERTEDLSRSIDRDDLELMGVKGRDMTISPNDGTSSFGEAVTLDESPLDPDVLWVGFDDGNLQVSRDGGKSWTEVSRNVRGIADGTYVSRITASARGAGVAYATFDGHRDGDFRPYVYRTEDFGRTWTPLNRTLPAMGVANVIVEHPDDLDALFLGTEHAVFASTDGGAHWARVPNLPTTHYDDLLIHPREKDLVMATHGRSIWILDDTRPFAEWSRAGGPAHLFSIAPAAIKLYRKDTSYRGQAEFAGENPVDGAVITYRLERGADQAVLRIHAPDGREIRDMTVPGGSGTHRVNWDLRHPLPGSDDVWERHDDPDLARPIEDRGPWVSPGIYTVTLEAGSASSTQRVEVLPAADMPITVAQYQEREAFMLELLSLQEEIRTAMRAAGVTGGRGFGPPPATDTPEGKLRAAARAVQQVYGALNGGAVRPGTLYPPTPTQREMVAQARALFAAAKGGE